jgi:hypothetical protein
VLFGVAGWLIVRIVGLARAKTGRRRSVAMKGARDIVAAAAITYLLFLATWGLNYRREPLTLRLDFDANRVTAQSLNRLALDTATELNRLWSASAVQADDLRSWVAELGPGFSLSQQALSLPGHAVPGRPKWSVLDAYFTRSGVAGMTDPLFLETLVASNLLPFERPASVAHEWGHLAGLARESDASFFGWLVCLRSGPAARYSGQLELLLRTLSALDPVERRAALGALRPEVQDHIRAIAERNRRDQVRSVSLVAWRVYDRFLRANRVSSGVRNYDEVVTLVLGTRFSADGVPALRAQVK